MNCLNSPAQPPCDDSAPSAVCGARLPAWLLPHDWPRDPRRRSAPALARIELADGRIAGVRPEPAEAVEAPDAASAWNARGAPVLPGLVEAHTHLDKAFTLGRMGTVRPGLLGAIDALIEDRARWTDADIRARATRGLQWSWEAGTTHLRTHVDWFNGAIPPPAWGVLSTLAHEWRDRLAIELAALAPLRFFADAAQAGKLARHAASTGPHARLGGFVHTSNWDTVALRHLVTAAADAGIDLDLHVDEELDPGAQGLATIAQLARETGFAGRIVCGHVCALAAMPEAQALVVLDAVARAPITLVSLPVTNLLLQDAGTHRTPRQRGITLVKEARARGIPLLFASDNVQDPFCRTGSLDPVETMAVATWAAQLDAPFDTWSDSICRADWLQRQHATRPSIEGAPADLVIFPDADATGWPSRTARRQVLRAGRLLRSVPAATPTDSGALAPA
ncbi:MAG: amidohydrolase family protein [Burkholderiaceae bacterium]|nr:amidohydrolase family protein [Burkholderiaceae bacterium]